MRLQIMPKMECDKECDVNYLSLSVSKTKFICLGLKQFLLPDTNYIQIYDFTCNRISCTCIP